tara:strand:- start:549 stop:692 length:144 start_codon:yes stop_codon:yes gene_type:complete
MNINLLSALPIRKFGEERERIWSGPLDHRIKRADIVVNGICHGCREN